MKTAFKTAMCIMPLFCKFANAQVPCEFDKQYLSSNSVGYKILETKNNDFLLLGLTNLIPYGSGRASFSLTKINHCGVKLWSVIHDTSLCDSSPCAGIVDLIEYPNESIIYAAYYSRVSINKKGVRIIKTDKNGNLIWKFKIGDTSQFYTLNQFIKINSKYFLLSGYITNNKNRACAIIADTFGNTIFQKIYNIDTSSNSVFTSAYWKSQNEITLSGYEDSALLIVNIDTLGNTVSEQKISKTTGRFKDVGTIVINFDSSEMFLVSNNYHYLARLNKLGIVIKDTNFNSHTVNIIGVLANNKIVIQDYKRVLILDSTFNVLWKDSTPYNENNSKISFAHSIQSIDNSLLYIGNYWVSTGFNSYYSILVRKKNLIRYVIIININGLDYINQKGGQIQLTATVIPSDAANQNVSWSVNDTSKAIINQTGLLTAKVNGSVTVTAAATDGSLIKAIKNVTITNQNVGIDENNILSQFISIYPNPANNYFEIEVNSVNIKNINLFDITGTLVNNFDLKAEKASRFYINTNAYSNGFYLLQIETDKGVLKRKIVINK